MARQSGRLSRYGASAAATLTMCALVVYAASPYVALWRMSVAFRSHDLASLRAEIDWLKVRDGLKDELTGNAPPTAVPTVATTAAVKPASISSTAADDELPEFGESFASAAVSKVVDEDCDPEHVEAMFRAGPPHAGGALDQARRMLAWAFFTGPESFQALLRVSDDPRQPPVRVRMVFTGGHGWQVTNVWLPQDMLAPPDAHAT